MSHRAASPPQECRGLCPFTAPHAFLQLSCRGGNDRIREEGPKVAPPWSVRTHNVRQRLRGGSPVQMCVLVTSYPTRARGSRPVPPGGRHAVTPVSRPLTSPVLRPAVLRHLRPGDPVCRLRDELLLGHQLAVLCAVRKALPEDGQSRPLRARYVDALPRRGREWWPAE